MAQKKSKPKNSWTPPLHRYDKDPQCNKYLEDMILREQAEAENTVTDALIWLRRALHFLSTFYQAIIDDTQCQRCSNDLSPFLKKAYSETLEPFHGWLGSQLFNVLTRFAPHRKHLILNFALDKPNRDQEVINDMRSYTNKMTACVRRLTEFYIAYNLETYVSV
ncbi:hypothetical protein JTB14_012012 [Gonioctena quinquepunctata]|nr:hypothetical protein JTB14_012012 [Gonioctena quinquepunctata]